MAPDVEITTRLFLLLIAGAALYSLRETWGKQVFQCWGTSDLTNSQGELAS